MPTLARPPMRELFDYVGFGRRDEALLAQLAPALRPAFPDLVEEFYRAVQRNPKTAALFHGGEAQIERQKRRLAEWLEGVVSGVYDDAYFEHRARIARAHVQIQVDQRYMLLAMNVVRNGLHRALADACGVEPGDRVDAHTAIDRICDAELAIMFETYRERYVERQLASERLATIGQLAATIGHELRNPLAVIETSLHLLRRRSSLDEGAHKHLDRIGEQVDLSGTIIEDLLALASDRPPHRQPVDLAELSRDAVSLLPIPSGVEVRVTIPDTLSKVRVDRTQVRQVVLNLVSNAVQAISGSGVGGVVEVHARLDGDGTLTLSVTDDGPGVQPEVRATLFEPLVTTRRTGNGLGLALCKRIVENHGGTITVEERPVGARFVLRLPPERGPAS